MDKVSIEDLAKLELKIGTVMEVGDVEGSEKLFNLTVDLGEETPRQVLSGIKPWYKADELKGKQVVVVANLEPRMMMGLESQAMILAADAGEGPTILSPITTVPAGAKIR